MIPKDDECILPDRLCMMVEAGVENDARARFIMTPPALVAACSLLKKAAEREHGAAKDSLRAEGFRAQLAWSIRLHQRTRRSPERLALFVHMYFRS